MQSPMDPKDVKKHPDSNFLSLSRAKTQDKRPSRQKAEDVLSARHDYISNERLPYPMDEQMFKTGGNGYYKNQNFVSDIHSHMNKKNAGMPPLGLQ